MNHLATIITKLEEAGLQQDVVFQINTLLAPVSPLFPLTNLIRLLEVSTPDFTKEVLELEESIQDVLAPLPRSDAQRLKLEKTVAWLMLAAEHFAKNGNHIEAIRSGWYDTVAKVVKALINEIKGNPTKCLARTFKCRECGSMEEYGITCSICGSLIRPCLGRAMTNGRCEHHRGNNTNDKGDVTLALQRQMLVKSDSRRRTLDKIHNSPDLLENTADIEILELRQQELFESLGELDLYELRESLKKKMKVLQKTIEYGGKEEAVAILQDLVFNAQNDDKIWSMISANAEQLSKLREREHKRIIQASEIITREMFEANLVKFRDAVLRGIGNVSRQLPRVIIDGMLQSLESEDYIAQKLPILLPANADSRIEKLIKEEVFKELSSVR